MARRVSSGRSRGFSGGGSRGSFRSSGSRGFKPSSSRNYGGYRYRHRPYRRDYFFHSLGPTGKVIYVIVVIILLIITLAMG